MPAFIRTAHDEKLWSEAKERVRSEYGLSEKDGDRFWARINGIYQRMRHPKGGESKKSMRKDFRTWLRKAAPKTDAEAIWKRSMEITRSLLSWAGEMEDMSGEKSRADWKTTTKRKESEYGSDETFADPAHHSYPLTRDGKPSHERTVAAWDYIHQKKNAKRYPDGGAAVKQRIASFARKHFPDMNLETEKSEHTDRGTFPGQRLHAEDMNLP